MNKYIAPSTVNSLQLRFFYIILTQHFHDAILCLSVTQSLLGRLRVVVVRGVPQGGAVAVVLRQRRSLGRRFLQLPADEYVEHGDQRHRRHEEHYGGYLKLNSKNLLRFFFNLATANPFTSASKLTQRGREIRFISEPNSLAQLFRFPDQMGD